MVSFGYQSFAPTAPTPGRTACETISVSQSGETYDTCSGDLPNGAALDTSTPGPHTFTITGTDAFQDPVTRTIHYNVSDPLPPVASAGAASNRCAWSNCQ